jgi:beta-glucosidase
LINLASKFRLRQLKDSLGPKAPILTDRGFQFRDLNKNGRLDIYEDPRQPIDNRVNDLLNQMTLEEMVGQMFSPMMVFSKGIIGKISGVFGLIGISDVIIKKNISTFAVMGSGSIKQSIEWHNSFQSLAERTRLGIPITLCSDPRHELIESDNFFANLVDATISKWPHPLGLAATRDENLVEEFGKVARQELAALGIRFALHPMADLATEPRWSRIFGTFGEDAELAGIMTAAYIRGFQGETLDKRSVACCLKHFPGGGSQKDGLDPHSAKGKDQIYPGNNFNYHHIPFRKAFEAGAAAVMPYYGQPKGLNGIEEVGFNFNRQITTDLLRSEMNFTGIVHTDYGIITGRKILGVTLMKPMSWGVEHLNRLDRVEKALTAGVDQLGGEACPELIIKLVNQGRISKKRISESCRRVLKLKFQLGLFENPYVDEKEAESICNHEEFIKAGENAMRRSLVLLKNKLIEGKPTLPLKKQIKVYVEGFSNESVTRYAEVVENVNEADFALLSIKTPFKRDFGNMFSFIFNQGDLDLSSKQRIHLQKIMDVCPTIIDIYLDRPAIIPELDEQAAAIIGNFAAQEDIILECIFGEFKPTGKLPFEMPRSMEAVRAQLPDVPYDSKDPLYPFGHGLSYEK